MSDICSFSLLMCFHSAFCLAPTSPRDVTARLVAPLKVEVRWRAPAVTNGDISHYYVYAIPLRSAVSGTTPQTVLMVYYNSIIILVTMCINYKLNFNLINLAMFAYHRHFLAVQEPEISH